MKRLLSITLLLALALIYPYKSQALVYNTKTDHAEVSIIPNVSFVSEDTSLELIVKLKIKNGWHIYWKDAGEIGEATKFIWQLEDNITPVFINQTAPTRINSEGFTQYINNGTVYYKFDVEHPVFENDVNIKGRITWLACNDECIPETARFDFTIPFSLYNSLPSAEWRTINDEALSTFPSLYQEKVFLSGNDYGILLILAMAFLGGIILNLMPCVLPILSIKAIALVQSSHKNSKVEAVLYLAGVVSSFMIIAGVLAILRSAGEDIGWGFQLQSPWFIVLMIVVFTIIFLMFLDIINFKNPFANHIGRISFNKQKLNAFFTGFFAVIIASPCTAPFMGIAIGYTLFQPLYIYFPIFLSLSIGYALPFTLISLFPNALGKILPKPGRWMSALKKIFSIPVFLTIIWLCWVLYAQLINAHKTDLIWEEYNEEKIAALVKNNEPVFIDFTAKWCITCIMNEKLVLETKDFSKLVEDKKIHLFKADWTLKDEIISKALSKYDRASIPLYVYYKNGDIIILPQLLTQSILKENLQ